MEVVGAAIVEAGRCLVARRSATMSSPHAWEFPGGKVEAGESPTEALVRELDEELGVTVKVDQLLGVGEAEAGRRRVRLEVYGA
ncbi:MAG: NUDIX domain-containing protein, partial [Myxococcales bacterium]|nr:NUDIX domain-containing protein [Myxococcales bacterium]